MPHIQSMSKIPEERRRKSRTRPGEAPHPDPLLCEKVCKICRSADVPTSEVAYRSVRTGVFPPLGVHARPLTINTGRAGHIPSPLARPFASSP